MDVGAERASGRELISLEERGIHMAWGFAREGEIWGRGFWVTGLRLSYKGKEGKREGEGVEL